MTFRRWCGVAIVLGMLSPGCGQSTVITEDTGLGDVDSGTGLNDGSVPPIDTGLPPVDTGVVPDDTGIAPDDVGVVVVTDAGGNDAAAVETCTTAGASESVPCGMCGSVTRFCSSSLEWAYGVCMGESGVCMPGTTSTVACGNCGTQPANCDASCHWAPTAACSGEGVCAPGARTRTGMGCPAGQTHDVLCDGTCTYQSASTCAADACPTPGASESVPCGMCGTVSRFCDVSHAWQYGTCMGEGGCMPGTTGSATCGMCGMQVTHCDATCQSVPFGSCTGEGVCAPGSTMRTATGCPAGQTRVMQCDAACGYTVEVSPCGATRPVDVMFILDATGSNSSALAAAIPSFNNDCVAPLLALGSQIQVGVSYMGEFPVTPYGIAGDRPFAAGVEPGSSASAIATNLTARPMYNGSDGEDATLAALSMLSGGAAQMSSTPFVCSSGRVSGGCWRTGSARIIVVHSDSPMHGGPLSTVAYSGISPVPPSLATVESQLMAQGIQIVWFDSTMFGGNSTPEFMQILAMLGQPPTDLHPTTSAGAVTTACGQLVTQVRTIAGL
jgi:hypothetical protein